MSEANEQKLVFEGERSETENTNFGMRILQEYEIKLNLTSHDMYSGMLSDPAFFMHHIREKFEGRCLDGTFIANIRAIQDRSMVSLDKNDLNGGGGICCVFRADAIVYPPDSILVGCEVSTIERDGRIICKYENAIIHLKGDKRFSPNKGDLIPVRVIRTGYPPGSLNMSIGAQPFYISPTFHMRLFKPTPFTAEEKDLINRKLSEYNDVKVVYDACDQKLVKFFEDLFYPFQDPGVYSNKDKNKLPFETRDILKLVTKHDFKADQPIVMSRHSAIPKSDPSVLILDIETIRNLPQSPLSDKTKLDMIVTPMTYGKAVLEMLSDHVSYLEFIARCCEVYNTEQIRKKHQKIWTIYTTIKIAL